MKFRPGAMRDIDNWVQHHADHMLYVYGENDPYGAERFRLGRGARDSHVFTVPGGNHGANVAGLVPAENATATAAILRWAGVSPAAVQADPAKAKPLAEFDAVLDKRDLTTEHRLGHRRP